NYWSEHTPYTLDRTKMTNSLVCATYLDPSTAAFADGIRHRGPRWIDHGQEASKAEVGGWEVHALNIKGVRVGKLILRKQQVAETWRKKLEQENC
uniref:Uncharacterized protein n=1 Tax=Erpetoichthys calabaricus TaxID=27687 RepID=A0A8C4T101_ERPCA